VSALIFVTRPGYKVDWRSTETIH